MKKKPQLRNRTEIIWELAKYADHSWFKNLLTMPTEGLRKLLAYYERGGHIDPQEDTVVVFKIGKVRAVRIGEPLKNVMKFKK